MVWGGHAPNSLRRAGAGDRGFVTEGRSAATGDSSRRAGAQRPRIRHGGQERSDRGFVTEGRSAAAGGDRRGGVGVGWAGPPAPAVSPPSPPPPPGERGFPPGGKAPGRNPPGAPPYGAVKPTM